MSVKKIIDVNKLVYTPKGEVYSEPKIDRKGRVRLTELDENLEPIWKYQHQMEKKDIPDYVNMRIGDIITFALDRLDDKADGKTIRERFSLSCRVEDAMKNGGKLETENKDWKCIEGTLEGIKHPLFNYRIQEAIDLAEVVKEAKETKGE